MSVFPPQFFRVLRECTFPFLEQEQQIRGPVANLFHRALQLGIEKLMPPQLAHDGLANDVPERLHRRRRIRNLDGLPIPFPPRGNMVEVHFDRFRQAFVTPPLNLSTFK